MIYSSNLSAFFYEKCSSILKKCVLANTGLLISAFPAMAAGDITDVVSWNSAFANEGEYVIQNTLDFSGQSLQGLAPGKIVSINGNGQVINGPDGSPITINNGAKFTLTNATLQNSATSYGAILLISNAQTTLSGQFLNNSSTNSNSGGAVTVNGVGGILNINADIETRFSGNKTNGVSNAIYNIGTVNMNAASADIIFDDKITGSNGTINVSGSNSVYFNETVTGNKINLSGGNLILAGNGNFDSATIFNASGGTLQVNKSGTISVQSATFANGSTLDIGENKVTMNSVRFNSGSTLALAINSLSSYGSLTANSWSVVSGAKLLATLAQNVVNEGESKEFALLGGNVSVENTANFAASLTENNNMYKFVASDTEAGKFIISQEKTGGDVSGETGGSTTNSSAAEAWVDSGKPFPAGSAGADLAEKLHQLAQSSKNGEFNAALTALAPEIAPVVRAVSMEIVNQVFSAVSSRMTSGGVYEQAEGLSAGDGLFNQAATWIQVLTNKSKLDDTAKAYGFDVDTNGVAMGIEKQFDARYKAGIGYAYSNSDVDAFMRDTNVEAHTFFAYGEYKPSRWFVNGIAAYTFSDYDENKNVAGGNYRAKYDVESLGLQVMAGYDALVKGVNVTPEAGFRYYRFDRNSYTDAAGQSVSSKKMDVLTAVLGTKVSKDFVTCGGTHWKPEARLALTYDIVSDKDNALIGLQNGAGYVVEGERLKRFGVETGAGIVIDVNDRFETRVGYEGKFRDNYTDHSGVLNLKYKF